MSLQDSRGQQPDLEGAGQGRDDKGIDYASWANVDSHHVALHLCHQLQFAAHYKKYGPGTVAVVGMVRRVLHA